MNVCIPDVLKSKSKHCYFAGREREREKEIDGPAGRLSLGWVWLEVEWGGFLWGGD
jgi:hypothetical protein